MPQPVQLSVVVVWAWCRGGRERGGGARGGDEAAHGAVLPGKPLLQHFATRKPSFRVTEAPLGRRSQHAAQQETALSEQHGSAKSQLQERLARRKAAMELKMAKAQQLAGAAG